MYVVFQFIILFAAHFLLMLSRTYLKLKVLDLIYILYMLEKISTIIG